MNANKLKADLHRLANEARRLAGRVNQALDRYEASEPRHEMDHLFEAGSLLRTLTECGEEAARLSAQLPSPNQVGEVLAAEVARLSSAAAKP